MEGGGCDCGECGGCRWAPGAGAVFCGGVEGVDRVGAVDIGSERAEGARRRAEGLQWHAGGGGGGGGRWGGWVW